jgi:hypothetical protein
VALITCTIVIAAIRCRRWPTLRRLKFIEAEPSCARYAAERSLVFERRMARSCLSRSINWHVAQARIPVRARLHEWVQEETVRHWLGDRPTNFLKARLNAASDS